MKKNDLSKKNEKELLKIVQEGKEKIQNKALNLSGTTKDSFEVRKIRKDIARALTYLNKK